MDIKDLEMVLKKSWDKNTSYPLAKDFRSQKNPALGQCKITSLIVQDYFGGDILYCSHHDHYWNKLVDGSEIDLTRSQFPKGTNICMDEIHDRTDLLEGHPGTKKRYHILKDRVEAILKDL